MKMAVLRFLTSDPIQSLLRQSLAIPPTDNPKTKMSHYLHYLFHIRKTLGIEDMLCFPLLEDFFSSA